MGKKRATIANFLRLLKLPAEVQLGLRDKQVDMGHARALLSVDNPSVQLKIYKEILKHGLSVRKVEEMAKAYQEGKASGEEEARPASAPGGFANHDFDILKKHLSSAFGAPVKFTLNRKGCGQITFGFSNEEDLARLITLFDNLPRP